MPINDFERILVTGGSGFMGRAVVSYLVSKGIRPLVVERSLPLNNFGGAYESAHLDVTDHLAVGKLVEDFRPDLAIHLAGVSRNADERSNDEVNYIAVSSFLLQLAHYGCKKTVIIGSAAEYGDNPRPFKESMDVRPMSPYAIAKSRATKFALQLHKRTGFDVTIVRAFTVYGPGQPDNMFVSQLVEHALLNRSFNMSDGVQRRDFVYIDDVVAAIVAAAESKSAAGRVINIGTGRAVGLRDAAEYVWSAAGADPANLLIGTADKTGEEGFDTMANITLAAELLNWHPATPFEAGVGKMLAERKAALATDIENSNQAYPGSSTAQDQPLQNL